MASQDVRSSAIVLLEPPHGEFRPGHCWWCGVELSDPARAIRFSRMYCYPDREGRDCVGLKRSSIVWSARSALLVLRKRDGGVLGCADCGIVCVDATGATYETWEADHEVPLEDGGAHAVENFRCRCVPCHRRKTAREATERADRRAGRARLDIGAGSAVAR